MTDKKIISLLPAATEILCTLGLSGNLAGVSHECDYPESIQGLPVCTASKVNANAGSKQIDSDIKSLLSNALSIYSLNRDLVRTLKPDVIITQSQCEVCAVSLADVEAQLADILDKDVKVISLHSQTLEGILNDIRFLGEEFGVEDKADILIEELEERINIIRHKLKYIEEKPSVACIEWLSPLMLAGNWIPGLVSIAGGRVILVEEGKHSPFIDFQKISDENPSVLLIMPCGFTIEQTLKEIHLLLELPGWAELEAVKNNRIYIADGNQYFNRPGPRIIDSLEILAEIIHPKQFVFGYEGKGWIRFNVN
jgi:iron complex transport system substrate-binding protein